MSINDKYEIIFTQECKKEIKKIYNYIRETLYVENAAKRIMLKIEELIKNLACTPKIYVEIDKYSGTKRIYRRIVVDNYVLLYTIDEENKKVYVSHMYYGGSDYIKK